MYHLLFRSEIGLDVDPIFLSSTSCQQKSIKEAYHVLCDDCACKRKVCAKCLESKEIVTRLVKLSYVLTYRVTLHFRRSNSDLLLSKSDIKTDKDLQREGQELERLLNRMTLRQRRSYLRKLERGDDLSHIKPEDFDNDDFDLGSDFDDFSDDDEDEDGNEDDEDEDEDEGRK
jgi:Uncharacterized conserved protein (DUF2039)